MKKAKQIVPESAITEQHLEKLYQQHLAGSVTPGGRARSTPPRAIVFELSEAGRGRGLELSIHTERVGPTAQAAVRYRRGSGLNGFAFEPFGHQVLHDVSFDPAVLRTGRAKTRESIDAFAASHGLTVVEDLGFDPTRSRYHFHLATMASPRELTLRTLEAEWVAVGSRILADWTEQTKSPVRNAVFYFGGELAKGLEVVYFDDPRLDVPEEGLAEAFRGPDFPSGKEFPAPADSRLSLIDTPIEDFERARRFFARVAARLESEHPGTHVHLMFHGEERSQDLELRAEARRRLGDETQAFVGGGRPR